MKLVTIFILATLMLQAQQTPATAKAEPTPTPITEPAKRRPPKPNPDGSVQIDITYGELFVARTPLAQGQQPALDKLFSIEGLPVKTLLGLRKTLAAVDAELKPFNEQRSALFMKWAKPKDGKFSIPPENQAAYTAEANALVDARVELKITQVPLSALGEFPKLSANDLTVLEQFLIDVPQTVAKVEEKPKQ